MIYTASVFDALFSDNPMNVVYALSLFAGLVYSVFLLFFHGIDDALGSLDFDVDIAADLGDLDVSHADSVSEAVGVSMLAIAGFVSAFGAFGLTSVTLFDAGTALSLMLALAGGLLVSSPQPSAARFAKPTLSVR